MRKWLDSQYYRLCSTFLILAALILSILALNGNIRTREENQTDMQASENTLAEISNRLSSLEAALNQRKYFVQVYENEIGIFSADRNVLYDVIRVEYKTLPAADRAQLKEGFFVYTDHALRALIEDYTS